MYKIALGAGHVLNTAGKRLPKELDPNQTREWWLNDRVCDKVEEKLEAYDGYALVRVDDTNGLVPNPDGLAGRCKIANDFGADVAVAVHHNAAGRIFSGGGIVVYRDPLANDKATVSLQEEMYAALIKHTGLKGNRSNPMAESALYVLRHTKMPAVLLELGFMDSTVDAPIILTEEYAEKCADAIVEVLVKRGGLTKKAKGPEPFRVQITVGELNIRKGPGTNYQSVGHAPIGVYTIMEESKGWGRLKSGQGWVPLNPIRKL